MRTWENRYKDIDNSIIRCYYSMAELKFAGVVQW